MTGSDLKFARTQRGWTQQQAARNLRVTQAYLSMLESGRRPVPDELALKFAARFNVSPLALPLEQNRSRDLAADLGALGYPGFAYLTAPARNPAAVLLDALRRTNLEARVVEALPWLVSRFAEMNWNWLVPRLKVRDRQNRLGFVVTLARELAERRTATATAEVLRQLESRLQSSRLLAEDVLSGSLTEPEREWLRANRSQPAKFWNVLSDLRVEHLNA